ncbi:helix-turn-helix transcriptional regulator [Achromobacter spanius]|uniref:helix-turn-helix transcriptional regulator n=2 Tax=Achromobacter spanius TaxID=217203 RepID=UPI003AF11CCE
MHHKTLVSVPRAMELSGHHSRSSFYRRIKTDPMFPRPIKLGRSTRFVLEEIVDWVEGKIAERDGSSHLEHLKLRRGGGFQQRADGERPAQDSS